MFCGYKMNEVITRERFAMARVRYVLTSIPSQKCKSQVRLGDGMPRSDVIHIFDYLIVLTYATVQQFIM